MLGNGFFNSETPQSTQKEVLKKKQIQGKEIGKKQF